MDNFTTLANGGELNKRSWDDFVNRLKYHCEGDGVSEHITANPIFIVQAINSNKSNWEAIAVHLTKEAAENFVKRQSHNFKHLRVYVNSLYWCDEFKVIQKAILDGRLQFIEGGQDEQAN